MRIIRSFFGPLIVLCLVVGCSSNDNGGGASNQDQFDRGSMLAQWADNMIVPAYTQLESQLAELTAAKNAFVETPEQGTLDDLRTAWLNAYKTWQYVEMFNIGKAEEIMYGFQMNVYPVTVADVENNIATGTYDLSSINNQDAVGFPALDYMLFGLAETDAGILAKYTTDTNATGYRTYLSDLSERMLELTSLVLDDWTSAYRDSFVNNTANTATGSVNKLTNDFIYYFERGLRAGKFGIPAGIFSIQPLSDRVEGYYSRAYSKMLALTALDAVQDFFNGKSYGSSAVGISFDDYLDYLRTIQGGGDLVALINGQFNAARTQMETLGDNLSQQVLTDNTAMTRTYDELQKVVILLKVDMVQRLNITIDYVDADGD